VESQELLGCVHAACPNVIDSAVSTLQSGGKLSVDQESSLADCVSGYCQVQLTPLQSNWQCAMCVLKYINPLGYQAVDACSAEVQGSEYMHS
jgi:hypothetical protein